MSEKRKEYKQKLIEKINEWDAKIDELEAQSGQAQTEAKQRYRETISDLRRRRDELKKRLEDVSEGSEAAWKEIRSGLDSALDDLAGSVKRAREAFKKGDR